MGCSNNNMGAIGAQKINKGYKYNSNGVITSIIGTQQSQTLIAMFSLRLTRREPSPDLVGLATRLSMV